MSSVCEPSIFNDIQKSARLFGGMPIALFGMITNIINIVVFLDPEMRCSLVNHFLLVLSISDLLLLVCNFSMLIFPVIASMSDSVVLHDTYPMVLWYSYPIGLSTQTCGVYLTVLVSVHRYLGVCHPFRAKRWVSGRPVKFAIIGSIVFSVLINLHTWLELNTSECYSAEFHQNIRSITLTELKMNATYNIITRCILYTFVMFIIPFVALIIVNWRIIVALKESTKMRNLHSSRKTNQSKIMQNFRVLRNAKYAEMFTKFGKLNFGALRNPALLKTNGNSVRDRSVTLMLLAIVAIFLCCNCLAFCNNIYEIVRDATALEMREMNELYNSTNATSEVLTEIASNQDTFDLSVELSNILISLNSSSSMFVYLIFSSKYRSIIKHWLGMEKRKRVNGVALTTAMVAQKALQLSILPDEVEARRSRREARYRLFAERRPSLARQNNLTASDTDLQVEKEDELSELGSLNSRKKISRDDSTRSSSKRKLLRFATVD